jgi:hypothetical protein
MSQVGLISSSESPREDERPTSKRRASTFAADDFDAIICGKDDENPQAALTLENLSLATNPQHSSPALIVRSPSRSEWTWTWGTLPIKASDPSIADLQSLTDLALREKLSSRTADQLSPNLLLSPMADGKFSSVSSVNQPIMSGHHEGESRLVPTETKNMDLSRLDPAEEIPQQTSFGDLPEPKYPQTPQHQPLRIRAHTLSDDYRHTSASPVARDVQPNGEPTLSPSASVPYHISARAATIASALGSDRILSLCAHILSSDSSPRSEEDLIAMLREHAVSPEEFSINPLDILNNPNLVVVVNNLLIPWRLVHAHLTAAPSTPREGNLQENLTVPANEKSNLWWAGRTVTNWGVWSQQHNHHDDNKHKTNEIISGNLSIPSVSRSASVRSIPSNTDGKSESRRDSYGNPDEDDFDQYECMSEGSSGGPSWSQTLLGHPTLEGMDTPGAHLWNKETLNWNSADDFQRLLNEYTNADAVPDLLLPYVTYPNAWPTVDTDHETSTVQTLSSISANLSDDTTPRQIQSLTLSRSHDTGLSMIGLKTQESKKQSSTEDFKEKSPTLTFIASPKLTAQSDEKTKGSTEVVVADEALKEDDGIEFLSLEDISPDEILPGPAREVYDGSDTDSFYSLNLDDDNLSHSSSSATGSANDPKKTSPTERKYRYRKTLVPTQEQIKLMELVDGMNEINFEVEVSFLFSRLLTQ